MGCIDSPHFWLKKILGLLTVGLIFTRAAAGGNPFPTHSADATDEGDSNSTADSEDNSERTRDVQLVESSALTDGAPTSGGDSPTWMYEGAPDTRELPVIEIAAELEVVRSADSALLHGSLQGSASTSTWRPRSSRIPGDDHGLPPSFSTVNTGEVSEPGTVVTNDGASSSSPRARPLPWWRRLWYRVRQRLSRHDYAQPRYPTPFNLNRFALLFAYVISTVLSSGGVLSWPSLRSILLKQGAYASLCPSSINGSFSGDPYGRDDRCGGQEVRIEQLYSLGSALGCIVCVFGGFLYRRIGPRVAAVVGQIFTMIGWGLLGQSSPSFVAHSAAIGIIGAVSALTSFPAYCVRQLFPHYEQVIVMVLGAALSASVAMPTIVLQAAGRMGIPTAIWGYIAIALLPSLLVAAFLIPRRDFSESRTPAARDSELEVSVGRQNLLPDSADSEPRTQLIQRRLHSLRRVWRILQQALPRRTWGAFIALVVYRTTILLTIGYYFQSSSTMLHEGASNSLQSMILFSPLFCLLFGLAAFVVAPIPLMAVASAAGLLSYVGPLLAEDVGRYLSTFCFSMYLGTALPQTLAILQSLTSEGQYPAFAGVLVMISGLLGSLSGSLYANITVGLFNSDPVYVQSACIVALALQFLWLFFLRSGVRRNENNTRRQSLPEASQTALSQDEGADDGKDAAN